MGKELEDVMQTNLTLIEKEYISSELCLCAVFLQKGKSNSYFFNMEKYLQPIVFKY